jgi:DNA-binding NarL/FixJ family response regulator
MAGGAGRDPITVVVGRFDPLLGRGLADVLLEDHRVEVLALELEGGALEQAVVRLEPRVAVVDGAIERTALARLRSIRPATGVLVLAHAPSLEFGLGLLAAEATCLDRSVSPDEILATVYLVAQGERIFAAANGHRVERRYPSDAAPLTRRQVEVLELLSRDLTDAQIALVLDIGVQTVNSHVAEVRRKLKVASRRDLVGMALPPALTSGRQHGPTM